jgi:hypothetical protein
MTDRTLTRDQIAAQATILRDALRGLEGISEKAMFGGTCFLLDGVKPATIIAVLRLEFGRYVCQMVGLAFIQG